jgi:hypothetical protein
MRFTVATCFDGEMLCCVATKCEQNPTNTMNSQVPCLVRTSPTTKEHGANRHSEIYIYNGNFSENHSDSTRQQENLPLYNKASVPHECGSKAPSTNRDREEICPTTHSLPPVKPPQTCRALLPDRARTLKTAPTLGVRKASTAPCPRTINAHVSHSHLDMPQSATQVSSAPLLPYAQLYRRSRSVLLYIQYPVLFNTPQLPKLTAPFLYPRPYAGLRRAATPQQHAHPTHKIGESFGVSRACYSCRRF